MTVENTAVHSNLQLNWSKSLLLRSLPHRTTSTTNLDMVKEVEHAKYVGVMLSRNGAARKDVTERLHFKTMHHCWRHTGPPLHWKVRIHNAVFVPMITFGMDSAAFTHPDLHRIEAFRAQCLRKMH